MTAPVDGRRLRAGSAPATTRPKRVDIQGLRAVAVLLVVLYHADLPGLPGGYIGVDVFFVISGFLMTGHLVKPLEDGGRIRFLDFYARRVKRLLPAALVVLAASFAASLVFLPPVRAAGLARDAAASALYVPNLWFAKNGTNYLSEELPTPFQHYWSLGVEEQFYLAWPLLIALVWLLSRRSTRLLGPTIGLVTASSFAVSVWMTGSFGPWAFFGPHTRAWEFGAGALVALSGSRLLPLVSGAWGPILAWGGLAGIAAGAVIYDENTAFPGSAALLPVLATSMVLAAGAAPTRHGAGTFLGLLPMQKLGDWSYSLYLWHWPVIIIPVTAQGGLPLWVKLLLAAACIPLAILTVRFIEDPPRNSPRVGAVPSWTVAASALACGFVAAALLVGAGTLLNGRLLTSDRSASPADVTLPVVFTDYVPTNGTPRLQDANADVPALSRMGCSPGDFSAAVKVCTFGATTHDRQYVLFGDSHAAQWFDAALATAAAHDAQLIVLNKSRCASIEVPRYVQGNIDQYCERWKDDAILKIKELRPELVMLSNLHVRSDQDGRSVTSEQWAAATARSVAKLAGTVPVVVIADSPWFDQSPILCGSQHLDDLSPCDIRRADVIDAAWVADEERATESAGGRYMDLTDAYCSTQLCNLVLGDTLIYRDNHHLTSSVVKLLAPRFQRALETLTDSRPAA